jgi:hypothetical protein
MSNVQQISQNIAAKLTQLRLEKERMLLANRPRFLGCTDDRAWQCYMLEAWLRNEVKELHQ